MDQINIAGIGELLWDLLPQGRQLGGAPANFVYHCNTLGANSLLVSALGDDHLGNDILKVLHAKQLSTDYIHKSNKHATGTVEIILHDQGLPQYRINENVAWDYIPFFKRFNKLLSNLNAICFGTLAQRNAVSRNTIQRALLACPESCLRFYDINIRQSFYSKEIIHQSLKIANGIKLNLEELDLIAKLFDIAGTEDRQIEILQEKYDLRFVVLTRGSQGSKIFTKEQVSERKASRIEIKDTVGAGDAFTAGFVIAFLTGSDLETAHEYAHTLATFLCTQTGAMPDYPIELHRELDRILVKGRVNE